MRCASQGAASSAGAGVARRRSARTARALASSAPPLRAASAAPHAARVGEADHPRHGTLRTGALPLRCARRRAVATQAAGGAGGGEPPKRPQDDPQYYERLFKLEADQVAGRDNLTSNIKLAAGVTLLLAALVAAFLASNGVL